MHSRIFCRVASNHVQNRACTLGNRAVYASRPHAFARGAFRYTQIRFLLDHYAPEYARARFAAIEQDHHALTVLLQRAKRSVRWLFSSLQSLYVLGTSSIKTEA